MAFEFGDAGDALLGAVTDNVDDLIGTIMGGGKFRDLFKQDSDIKQYSEEATDLSKWHGILQKTDEYAFLLKVGGKTTRIPFLVAPQREVVIEPHAMTSTPTQGGGKIIQSDGSPSKEIQIQGTCGLYPFQNTTRMPTSGAGSGLEGFKFLQNVFRRYTYLKRFGNFKDDLALIYVSVRRQEAWVVEPKQFWSEDATEHNFNFTYNITLEALYPYDGRDAKGLLERLLSGAGIFQEFASVVQRFAEALDKVNALIGKISAYVDGFVDAIFKPLLQIGNMLADIKNGDLSNLRQFTRDATKSLIRNLRTAAFTLERAGAGELAFAVFIAERACTRLLVQDRLYEQPPQTNAYKIQQAADNVVSSFIAPDGSFVNPLDALNGGSVASRPDITRQLGSNRDGLRDSSRPAAGTGAASVGGSGSMNTGIDAETAEKQVASDEINGLKDKSFRGQEARPSPLPGSESRAALETIDSTRTSSTPGSAALNEDVKLSASNTPSQAFPADSITPPENQRVISAAAWKEEYAFALTNIDAANADYRVGTVGQGDSVQTLAKKLVGDPGRWLELVLLNNLEYPYIASQAYIDANNLTNVLAFGSQVIFPVPKQSNITPELRKWRNENDVSVGLDPRERALGNDIYLDPNTRDIVFGPNDTSLVYGKDNMAQYFQTMISLRRGRWRRAPSKGLTEYNGISRDISFPVLRAEISDLFSEDPRVTSVQTLSVRKLAHELLILVAVFVRNYDDPIIVTQRV